MAPITNPNPAVMGTEEPPKIVPINAPTVPMTTIPNTTSSQVLVDGRLIVMIDSLDRRRRRDVLTWQNSL